MNPENWGRSGKHTLMSDMVKSAKRIMMLLWDMVEEEGYGCVLWFPSGE